MNYSVASHFWHQNVRTQKLYCFSPLKDVYLLKTTLRFRSTIVFLTTSTNLSLSLVCHVYLFLPTSLLTSIPFPTFWPQDQGEIGHLALKKLTYFHKNSNHYNIQSDNIIWVINGILDLCKCEKLVSFDENKRRSKARRLYHWILRRFYKTTLNYIFNQFSLFILCQLENIRTNPSRTLS